MPHRQTTKSPLQLAQVAYAIAKEALARYSSPYSRRDFTQAQLFALLALRQFFQTDYRGIVQLVGEFSELRRVLELEQVPHFTTLQKAERRLLKKGALTGCWLTSFDEQSLSACCRIDAPDPSIRQDSKAAMSAAIF
jgi:hypothetical protein